MKKIIIAAVLAAAMALTGCGGEITEKGKRCAGERSECGRRRYRVKGCRLC